jgi:uracil-DNA glycosylase
MTLDEIRNAIMHDKQNISYTEQGYEPLYLISPHARILIVGQAPGIKAQNSGLTWNDLSGDRLRSWLGVSRDEFYNPELFAMIPMDFYYPGKGKSGDLPPRKGFAEKWHPELLKLMPNLKLIILVGSYATNYYLKDIQKETLTETIRSYDSYLPKFIPLVHPSPRNISWHVHNPWFLTDVIPRLQSLVKSILKE